jgi:hypothetical protein
MSTMRILVRLLLALVFTAAIVLVAFLLLGPKSKETATLTAVLAVIAAVISAWPSLRVLEIQEDATRPYFDAQAVQVPLGCADGRMPEDSLQVVEIAAPPQIIASLRYNRFWVKFSVIVTPCRRWICRPAWNR